ncbi:antigenic cell wall galactomannoprotein-like protein [Xylogone sp. PMI_703]|nr:antigenic cell wall galactomannoprotein-like protein [Xylogone sp. PMI_703]
MLIKKLLSLALLATPIVADGAAVVEAIESITNKTIQLNSTVSSWRGDLLGALPITVQSTELLSAINSGTNTAQRSANFTTIEVITIAGVTQTLVTDVLSTLSTIQAAKTKFEKLLLGPAILLNLVLEKEATDKFQAAVIAKVPAELQSVAEQLVAPVDPAFSSAITDYEGL